ncbi:glutamate--tRNA ligase [bacterium]|nr:glutamate--tRNA ligase [bacterium]
MSGQNVTSGENVRVRFAPSPTGDLHIGGVRTALFNWLFARHHQGTFLLRIEDSDEQRSTQASSEIITQGMSWLGLEPDEAIIYQSSRRTRHQEVLQRLFEEGKAYYCDCPPDLLEEKREKAIKEGRKPKYDGRCRQRGLGPEGHALRFRAPDDGSTTFFDHIRGEVTFLNEELDDLIICRSNGTSTYNFLVVVDDIDMRISHVIRGEDHIANTPKQVLIYKALNATVPQFAHLPIVLGPDKTRLSKRHGASSVLEYYHQGFLADGLINYIARLGWAHGDQEIFTRQELIDYFDLAKVNKSAAVFDPEKLLWVNAQHIKLQPLEQVAAQLKPFLVQKGYQIEDCFPGQAIVDLFKERSKTLVEMASDAEFIFNEPQDYDPVGAKKFLRPIMIEPFQEVIALFEKLPSFTRSTITETLETYLGGKDWKLGKIAQPIRVAVTGKTVSPGIHEVLETLGQEKTLIRMKKALVFMQHRSENDSED